MRPVSNAEMGYARDRHSSPAPHCSPQRQRTGAIPALRKHRLFVPQVYGLGSFSSWRGSVRGGCASSRGDAIAVYCIAVPPSCCRAGEAPSVPYLRPRSAIAPRHHNNNVA